MAYVTAKALKDGPYEVSGGAKILDHTGKEYVESAIDPRFICAAAAQRRTKRSATAATKTSLQSGRDSR
jgi:hypothetical protein